MRMTDECLAAMRANETCEQQILNLFGFFGHYMFVNRGGLGGKQHVLKTLLRADGEMTQRELLEQMNITSASLSEVLGKLEREGLVERTRSAQDKRQLEIVLTGRGRDLAQEMADEEKDFESRALDFLDDDEKHALLSTLDVIFDHWREMEKATKCIKEETECRNKN